MTYRTTIYHSNQLSYNRRFIQSYKVIDKMSSKILEKNHYFLIYNFLKNSLSFRNKIYFIKKIYTLVESPFEYTIYSKKKIKGHYLFKKFSSFNAKSDRFVKKSLSKISIRLKDNPFFEYELYVIVFLRFFIDNNFFHSLLKKSYVKILHGEYDSLYIDKYRLKHVFFEKENKSWYDRYITKYYKINNYLKDPIWKSISECFRQLHILLFILNKNPNYKYSLKKEDYWKSFSRDNKYVSCYYEYFMYDLKWSVVFLLRILRYSQSVLDRILYHTYERYLYHRKILSSYLRSFTLFWLFFLVEQHSLIRKKRKLSFYSLNDLLFSLIGGHNVFSKISLKESYKNSYYYIRNCFSKIHFCNIKNGSSERVKKDSVCIKSMYTLFLHDLYFFEQEQEFLYNFLLNINYVIYTIKNSKNKIASHYDFLISFLSRKYSSTDISYEDILIYSTKGLYKAIDRFEVHKNCKFTTYAFWWVKQSVSKLIQDTLIRVPSEYILFLKDLDKSKRISDFSFSKEFIKSLLNLLYQERSYYYIKSTEQNKRLLTELRFQYNLEKKKIPIVKKKDHLDILNEFSSHRIEDTSLSIQDIYKTNISILRILLLGRYPYRIHSLNQMYKIFNIQDNKFKSYIKSFVSTKI